MYKRMRAKFVEFHSVSPARESSHRNFTVTPRTFVEQPEISRRSTEGKFRFADITECNKNTNKFNKRALF